MSSQPEELLKTLANHDAAINTLGGRMSGVETSVHKLQGEVHTGFAALGSKLDKLDARPTFNFHEWVRTAQSIGITVGLIVAAIIWIVNGSFSGVIVKQDSLNTHVTEKLREQGEAIKSLAERTQWLPSAPKRN